LCNDQKPNKNTIDEYCGVLSPQGVTSLEQSQIVTDSMIKGTGYGNQAHQDLINKLMLRKESYIYVVSGFFDKPLNSIEKFD